MTRKVLVIEAVGDIQPHRIYRTTLAPTIFGYAPQRARDLEMAGELPPSFPLSPSSKYRAWLGQDIINHRNRMRELSEANAKAKAARPKQEQPLALKIKKQKLRPPK
jgi:hypothetical protein